MNKYFITLFLLVVMCFISCDNDNSDEILTEIPEEENVGPYAVPAVSKAHINLFEMTMFYIEVNENSSVSYDSIVWDLPNIFRATTKEGYFLHSFGQSFCLPGEYNLYMSIYKDTELLSRDSVAVSVDASGDFFGIDWNTSVKDSTYFNYISRIDDFVLKLNYRAAKSPYAELTFSPFTGWRDRYSEGRQVLFDCITKLYGENTFNYDGNNIELSPLVGEYNKRFDTPLVVKDTASYVPITIWDTDRAHIALLRQVDNYAEYYWAIAEPRKF
ncbi:MAG: hypothetical protein QM660_06755 [Dysgonomonas sp.]